MGGGSPSETTTISKQEMSAQQKQLLGLAMPAAKDHARTPMELFPGSTIAGPTQMQQTGREMVTNAATGDVKDIGQDAIGTARALMQAGGIGATQGATSLVNAGQMGTSGVGRALQEYDATQGGRDFLASGALLDPSTNPVLHAQTEAALRPITQNLQEQVLPGIRSNSINNKMFGSSRQGIAEGRAIGDYLRQAGDISTNLQANNFNEGLGAMLQTTQGAREGMSAASGQGLGAGASGTEAFSNMALRSLMEGKNLANLAFLPGLTLEAVGGMQQQENQAKLSEEANRFTTEQMIPFLQAQDITNMATGLGGGSAITKAQQAQPNSGMQTAAGIGQLLMMLML